MLVKDYYVYVKHKLYQEECYDLQSNNITKERNVNLI